MQTIKEIAVSCELNKDKLLSLIQETFPQATMNSPISSGAFFEAMENYEKKHFLGKYKKGGPAPSALTPTGGTAPAGTGNNLHREVNAMSDDRYDEYATDKESKRQWEADADIRAEFLGDYESFKHFRRSEAQGLHTILGG